jgi:hypothetical protein
LKYFLWFQIKGIFPVQSIKHKTTMNSQREPAAPKPKTINDLVRISTTKSKRISSGCFRLGSNPKMKVPYPLWHIVIQNHIVDRINHLLAHATSGSTTLSEFEAMEHHPALERQPATEPDMWSCDSEEML